MINLPALSVIVVNWNTSALLQQCLASLGAGVGDCVAQVIVVDNASTDDSVEKVRREFKRVQLIVNSQNVGFARANNQGLAASEGKYVLLLNSDTIVPANSLAQLVEFMEKHADVGACGPRLLQSNGQVQPFAFGGDPTPSYLMGRAFSRFVRGRTLHDWSTSDIQPVEWVAGTCLLARREVIAQVGPLDERFFMYFEDDDWCLRMRQHGWKIFYNPTIAITHLGGKSLAQNPQAKKAYYTSLQYFYAKHYGTLENLWLRLALPFYRAAVRY